MLKPVDIDLPSKFVDWRRNQLEIIFKIVASQKYAFLLDSPTGTGKSLIGAAVQRFVGKNAVYLCTTTNLQDQLLHDFPYAKLLMGRGRYKCLKFPQLYPRVSAIHCTHKTGNECDHVSQCPYRLAKAAALSAPLAVLNTAYFLAESNYVGGFDEADFVIIDEFDTVEGQLLGFVQVAFNAREVAEYGIQPPQFKTKASSWQPWALDAKKRIDAELEKVRLSVEGSSAWSTPDFQSIKALHDLEAFSSRIGFLAHEVNESWVYDETMFGWVFKPTWISRYAGNLLWKRMKRVLGMSATILDPEQIDKNTGLTLYGERGYDYISLDSPFPVENRPIFYEPVAAVTRKNELEAYPAVAGAISRIMTKHPVSKILVHTVSYKLRDYIQDHVKSDRFITHDSSNRNERLEYFMHATRPLVMLSPSMDRGVDLAGDEYDVVVICKLPYPNLGDKQISKRVHGSKDGNAWYRHQTACVIIQMCGRHIRSVDKKGVVYILDEKFGSFVEECRNLFPKWFLKAVVM